MKYKLTESQTGKLKTAVFMISDAKVMISEIEKEIAANGQWECHADIAAVLENLHQLCKYHAGGIGYFLKTL